MKKDFSISSESVTEGHPDKIADQISDVIVDAYLEKDKNARVACEASLKGNNVWIYGETKTEVNLDKELPEIIKNTIKLIGYTHPDYGLDYKSCSIESYLANQSLDISQGVSQQSPEEQGAGDQGMMFGYACKDTPELMPLPISLAHKLTSALAKARKNKILNFLRPDGKSQVTIEYENFKPKRIRNITLAAQHDDIDYNKLREALIEEIIIKTVPSNYLSSLNLSDSSKVIINGTGKFIIGGPQGDAGLTGRKIIVDTYGGFSRHGGGAFSGKDPSKVDRSACYLARYIAKNIVAADLADRCEVQLAYTIGVAEPNNLMVDTFGTGRLSDAELEKLIKEIFPLKPGLIINELKLKNPIYFPTASYGHFGRLPFSYNGFKFFSWEQTDKADQLNNKLIINPAVSYSI